MLIQKLFYSNSKLLYFINILFVVYMDICSVSHLDFTHHKHRTFLLIHNSTIFLHYKLWFKPCKIYLPRYKFTAIQVILLHLCIFFFFNFGEPDVFSVEFAYEWFSVCMCQPLWLTGVLSRVCTPPLTQCHLGLASIPPQKQLRWYWIYRMNVVLAWSTRLNYLPRTYTPFCVYSVLSSLG